jgi:hypothetical protein
MKIPSLTLPKYTTILPVSKQKVTYRPFMVREEKVLLFATQAGNLTQIVDAIYDTVSSCTFGECDGKTLAQVDVEFLFLQIRNKSSGEGVDAEATCVHCGKKTDMTLDFSTATVTGNPDKITQIQLSETSWIKLKYPTLEMSKKISDFDEYDQQLGLLVECVESIIVNDELYSAATYGSSAILEFLETLSQENFQKLESFFIDLPELVYESNYNCVKCGESNRIFLKGLESFFV